ncbi:MAG TPA: hypothetical protein VLR90_01635 [Blastocatellia bacterium]|nr:hypothetical protein [Blastocatellia bacterium]
MYQDDYRKQREEAFQRLCEQCDAARDALGPLESRLPKDSTREQEIALDLAESRFMNLQRKVKEFVENVYGYPT